jgi:hypothetical protein
MCRAKDEATLASVKRGRGGIFRYVVRPGVSMTIRAGAGGRTSTPARISVSPLVTLTRESAGRYRVDVSTTNGVSLDGARATIQRLVGKRWRSVGTTALSANSPPVAMTAVSTGVFARNLYGAKLRALVAPSSCYAGAASPSVVG